MADVFAGKPRQTRAHHRSGTRRHGRTGAATPAARAHQGPQGPTGPHGKGVATHEGVDAGSLPAPRAGAQCRPLRVLTLPSRRLEFPDDGPAGTLYLRRARSGRTPARSRPSLGSWRWAQWRELGTAIGVVTVPAGSQIWLRASAERPLDSRVARRLRHLDLQGLTLPRDAASDQALAEASLLTGLAVLDLWGAPIGDEHLEAVARLAGLRDLRLWGTQVSDAGLAALAPLQAIRRLSVPGPRTGDEALWRLAGLSSLRELDLSGSAVTDAGLRALTGLRSLTRLSLWRTQVTDAGLRHLHRLHRLAEIDLGATAVTDRGLASLRRLPLRRISLEDALVSPEGLRGLRAAMPHCRVEPVDEGRCPVLRGPGPR